MAELPDSVDDALSELTGTPSTAEVRSATRWFPADEIASAGISLAMAGGGGGSLPAPWTDGGNGDVTASVDDATKTPLTIDLPEEASGRAFQIRDHDGNALVDVDPDGTITVQDAAGSRGFIFDPGGVFRTFGLVPGAGISFGTDSGIHVLPTDTGSDGLDLDGAHLVAADGAAMIVLRNPIGNMPDNFYSPDMVTINADLTAGDAKLLIKAQDTNGDVVTAEIPLT